MQLTHRLKISLTLILLAIVILASSVLILPSRLFNEDFSTVVLDRNGRLLGAKLAEDEQWRFKPVEKVPPRFKIAILTYEDKYFYDHPGINIISIFNSLYDNIKERKVVRGASTISMQVIRMSRNGKRRTIVQKLIETYLTIGMEILYTKDSILNIYCSNAPMGGNIVGLNAASWRYFGHAQHELSWAEAATLAVLPNSPSIIHPGKNRKKLIDKRNSLLSKLLSLNHIDSTQYQLAILEEIPEKPVPLPSVALHLVEHLSKIRPSDVIVTTIDYNLQVNANQIAQNHGLSLLENGINNVGVLIVSPKEKEVLAYIGNLASTNNYRIRDHYNDMVMAKRSTGSILKPFLYASMIGEGMILPNSLVRDIPSYFNNYHPENYDGAFRGTVPARLALSQSLNVPAVYMLQEYGAPRFINQLHRLGFSSFNNSPDHYGLSLILGGGEASLFELVNAYAGMAATLISYDNNYGEYPVNAYDNLKLYVDDEDKGHLVGKRQPLTASSIWLTYEALKTVSRPQSEDGWEFFSSSSKIAWKTGTSHGFKDAWSIGTSADYIIGVWAGNANGEGRTGLSGTRSAAPIMFDLFNIVEFENNFHQPYDEMVDVEVCRQSGYLASPNCKDIDTVYVPEKGQETKVCSYHKLIFTDSDHKYQISQRCSNIVDMTPISWFVLPPVQEYYYKTKHPDYKTIPPYAEDCEPQSSNNEIEFIYPVSGSSIYVATDGNSEKREIVFKASHHYTESVLYWHLDNKLIGITSDVHNLTYVPKVGEHTLTIVDGSGNSNEVDFRIIR